MADSSAFVNNIEVTPRIPTPPLITHCDKGTQTISPYLHVKLLDLGKRLLQQQWANKRLSNHQTGTLGESCSPKHCFLGAQQ
ncbi:hypothetical protein TNCV_847541 [Trichonephila clavipes]|nr:hypothetical protein TNCV_847541 [Trichonephila clavipes]